MKHLSFLFGLFFLTAAQAAVVRSVPSSELGEPSMLGRYDEGRDGEVLIAAIPKNGALELWVIVQSRSNYSVSYDFPLGKITSLDSVEQMGDGEFQILVGVDGVPESKGVEVDVTEALRDIETGPGLYRGRQSAPRATIDVEWVAVEAEAGDASTEVTKK